MMMKKTLLTICVASFMLTGCVALQQDVVSLERRLDTLEYGNQQLRKQNDKSFGNYLARQKRYDQFIDLILQYRNKLQTVYGSAQVDAVQRAQKKTVFAELLRDYENLKQRWGGYTGFDNWMFNDLNNAKLASVGNYHQWVPSLDNLLKECSGDLPCFYKRANAIAKLKPEARLKELLRLAQS